MGCVCAIVFTCFGAAYGTAKAGVGVCSTAVLRPDLVVKISLLASDAGVRGTAQQPRLYVGMILILIFAEVLGLYGLIVALLMNSHAKQDVEECT
ncbi:hypothetical protein PENARI_c010G09437 [Penicillium arizonense]|uniref:V-ATPase proteolipid subunit C-like domain-containing protein n=1 Tax=Penicillium arizonense TaxID=1835702 RepID=A0A1F5LGX6_PENAI|nr:hypothetical protein PENARI_c010G09437 [Penicillium arizonense]OGE52474.1 hypothetical protein PENARI_c010G09437 [Penicillium arizonense]